MNPSELSALKSDPWLLSLPAEARDELIAVTIIKRYKRGEVLIRKDEDTADLFGLLSGRVRISAATFSGSELVFTSVLPGDWFGEISILDGRPRTHDALAAKDSTLAIVPRAAISQLCKQNQLVHRALVQLLCDHCRLAFSAIDDFLLLTPEQRLVGQLLRLADYKTTQPIVRINQQELSSLVGVSRQSVSKVLKKWEQSKFISLGYNSIELISVEQLSNIIEK